VAALVIVGSGGCNTVRERFEMTFTAPKGSLDLTIEGWGSMPTVGWLVLDGLLFPLEGLVSIAAGVAALEDPHRTIDGGPFGWMASVLLPFCSSAPAIDHWIPLYPPPHHLGHHYGADTVYDILLEGGAEALELLAEHCRHRPGRPINGRYFKVIRATPR